MAVPSVWRDGSDACDVAPPKASAMRPLRRWTVWLVVLAMGIGWASEPCRALTASDRRLVIPIEAPEEQSGEPDTPTGPGQVQGHPEWRDTSVIRLALLVGPLQECLLARLGIVVALGPRER